MATVPNETNLCFRNAPQLAEAQSRIARLNSDLSDARESHAAELARVNAALAAATQESSSNVQNQEARALALQEQHGAAMRAAAEASITHAVGRVAILLQRR